MTVMVFTSYLIYKDYTAFLSLGPGGTPCTLPGYLRVTVLRVFALRNRYEAPPVTKTLCPQTGLLCTSLYRLPSRASPRPIVAGIAPQRQMTQRGSRASYLALDTHIKALARRYPAALQLGTSCFEKHGTGLFLMSPLNRTCQGEICHAHPSDGSLHMTLHPQDIQWVLERGWGERHPLAKGGWLANFVPLGFVMIYAPRDQTELDVVMAIISAAIWWVGGQTTEKLAEAHSCEAPLHPSSLTGSPALRLASVAV
ncbi:MAG: hypothetical protein M1838_003870 [Thelocarpon superellum]|nr:MAG: hypothetical protein M1838_003870 [Thelocarpon superellum]